MSVNGWEKLGSFTVSAIEIEEAMRKEFWDRHGQPGSSVTKIVVKWQKGKYGQPEIAAGWPGRGVGQFTGSARNVFWLAFEILRGKVDLPKRAYPDDVLSSVDEENLVKVVVWGEKETKSEDYNQ